MKITIKNKEYELKLTTRGMVDLEKQLGANPLQVLSNWNEDNLPTFNHIALFLWAMLQKFNHGITINDSYDLIDDYIADGHNIYDFIPTFVEVLQDGGFIPKVEEESKN